MTEKKFEFTHAADVQPIGRATVGEDGAATAVFRDVDLGPGCHKQTVVVMIDGKPVEATVIDFEPKVYELDESLPPVKHVDINLPGLERFLRPVLDERIILAVWAAYDETTIVSAKRLYDSGRDAEHMGDCTKIAATCRRCAQDAMTRAAEDLVSRLAEVGLKIT